MTSIFTHAPEALPALYIKVTGEVTVSNLADYKAKAMTVIGEINRDLKTDQDFAVAENMVKWCADTEGRLADEKGNVLAQTKSINEVIITFDEISAEVRRVRLELARLVKDRKDDIRGEIVAGGLLAMDAHIESLNAGMGKPYMPKVSADFGGAVKGKRTIDSLKAAVNAELGRAKGEADAIAKTIMGNLESLRSTAADHKFLFADAAQIVLRPCGEVVELIKARIDKHQAAEAARIEADRERIRKEEQDRLAREQVAQEPEILKDATFEPAPPAGPPTLRLGQIAERLGFALPAAFLQTLGFEPAGKDRAAVLYHEGDFPRICAALVVHIQVCALAIK